MSFSRYYFSSQDNRGIRNTAKLLYVSSAKYGGDWHSTPHAHNCTELFYVTGGEGQFYIEGNVYPVSSNDLVIVNPHVEHTEISLNATPLEYIVLGVDGLQLSVSDEREDRYCIVNFRNIRDRISFYLQNMLREIEQKAPGYETICQDLMEVLVIHLTRQTDFSTTMEPIRKSSSRLCATVRRYIDEHFKENINLDMLAQLTHSSKYYMVHAFSEEYGISPINYMISRRIEESRYLLQETDMSMSQIARILGFSSASYFSQSFRRAEGISPIAYRKGRKA